MNKNSILHIEYDEYCYILDSNNGAVRTEIGPKRLILENHESIKKVCTLVHIPSQCYCVVENPVLITDNQVTVNEFRQAEIRNGKKEIRFSRDPFPLYWGEKLLGEVMELKIIEPNHALFIKATSSYTDTSGIYRDVNDEWVFNGPGIYYPHIHEEISSNHKHTFVQDSGMQYAASRDLIDGYGNLRLKGEEWIIKTKGFYSYGPYEKFVKMVESILLTLENGMYIECIKPFKNNTKHKTKGDKWLITKKNCPYYILEGFEKSIKHISLEILEENEFCYIKKYDNAIISKGDNNRLVVGPKSFFLLPGEFIHGRIEKCTVLKSDQGVVLRAKNNYMDEKIKRVAGEKWLIKGPCVYTPKKDVEIVTIRETHSMNENEGIYVRDLRTGQVRAISGTSYMLTEYEELASKFMPAFIEACLYKNRWDEKGEEESKRTVQKSEDKYCVIKRKNHEIISYHVPQNSVVQLYELQSNNVRIVFGPNHIVLKPHEQFKYISLSGGMPKDIKKHKIIDVCLKLGPDFYLDMIKAETSDHACLDIKLAYNWAIFHAYHFNRVLDKNTVFLRFSFFAKVKAWSCNCLPKMGVLLSTQNRNYCNVTASISANPHFLIFLSSMIRSAIASVSFDHFHKNSSSIIRKSIFGVDEKGIIKNKLKFSTNRLVISGVDIRSVTPCDKLINEALQKSVELAIDITTKTQAAAARHAAQRAEQKANGILMQTKILNQSKIAKNKNKLLELQHETEIIKSMGNSRAECLAEMERSKIFHNANIEFAEYETNLKNLQENFDRSKQQMNKKLTNDHLKAISQTEYEFRVKQIKIENEAIRLRSEALGKEAIGELADAKSIYNTDIIKAMNLKTTIIMNPNDQIDLISTVDRLISQ
ncbi:Major vault protein [Intoshia linei]|uniref:Major vault protein n=1 Tax=Intoshia linei TaxID=1819745 RepID=A0A177B7H9_9BILA|nr:Major vault protein [Intoshia linei]